MTRSMFDLTGKVAIVTGGYSGIGRGISEGLAEAGANVVICARNLGRCQEACSEIEKLGVKALPIRCDVTRTDEVNNLIETTVKEFGKVDILVNNAGIIGGRKPIIETSDEDWDTTLNINLKGAFLCSRAAAREMIKRNEGKIINVSSISAFIGTAALGGYCASKRGLVQLTRVMALELVEYNIQVNAICPGSILTPMNYEYFTTQPGKGTIKRDIPMGRIGDANELKGIAVYLASPASSFATGTCIVVDGGQTVW